MVKKRVVSANTFHTINNSQKNNEAVPPTVSALQNAASFLAPAIQTDGTRMRNANTTIPNDTPKFVITQM